jgi:hypothetical protein
VTKDQRKLVIAWNDLVTLKVEILAWRLFQNRILSKDNLFKRGVLNKSQSRCGNGCGVVEIVTHLFFECYTSVELWQKILLWLNLYSTLHNTTLQKILSLQV